MARTAHRADHADTRHSDNRHSDIRAEAVASLFWMYLNLPEDASRSELESCADSLISRIEAGDPELAIEQRLKAFQTTQLCLPLNVQAITQLTQRILQIVKRPERIGSAGRVTMLRRAG